MDPQGHRSLRRTAWLAGSALLLGLGIACLAVAVVGLIMLGGGVSFVVLAIPLLAAGTLAARSSVPAARVLASSVAFVCAALIAFVATAPLRGLTPPPGQPLPVIDGGAILLAAGCAIAGVLVLAGDPGHRRAAAAR